MTKEELNSVRNICSPERHFRLRYNLTHFSERIFACSANIMVVFASSRVVREELKTLLLRTALIAVHFRVFRLADRNPGSNSSVKAFRSLILSVHVAKRSLLIDPSTLMVSRMGARCERSFTMVATAAGAVLMASRKLRSLKMLSTTWRVRETTAVPLAAPDRQSMPSVVTVLQASDRKGQRILQQFKTLLY